MFKRIWKKLVLFNKWYDTYVGYHVFAFFLRSIFALWSYSLYSILVMCCFFYLDIIITNILDRQVDTLLVYVPAFILKAIDIDINVTRSTFDRTEIYLKFAFIVSILISLAKLLFSIFTGRTLKETGIPSFFFVGFLTFLMLISLVSIYFTSVMHSPIERVFDQILFWGVGLVVFTIYRIVKIVAYNIDKIIKKFE